MNNRHHKNPRFPLGRVLATPGAIAALEAAQVLPKDYLACHVSGDWGDLDEEDQQANEQALIVGARLFSAYSLPTGVRIWIITEADRSASTLLLPSEY